MLILHFHHLAPNLQGITIMLLCYLQTLIIAPFSSPLQENKLPSATDKYFKICLISPEYLLPFLSKDPCSVAILEPFIWSSSCQWLKASMKFIAVSNLHTGYTWSLFLLFLAFSTSSSVSVITSIEAAEPSSVAPSAASDSCAHSSTGSRHHSLFQA